MTALLLAAALGVAPVVQVLARADAALGRLERLQVAARRLDQAEAAVLAARTPGERRAAWRAWQDARTSLRSAAR